MMHSFCVILVLAAALCRTWGFHQSKFLQNNRKYVARTSVASKRIDDDDAYQNRIEKIRVRFREKGLGNERVYSSQVVNGNVPQQSKKKKPLFVRLVQPIFRNIFGNVVEKKLGGLESIIPDVSMRTRQTRLLTERAYAREEPFTNKNIAMPPSLEDLSASDRQPLEGFWITTRARYLSFGISYLAFPFLTKFLDSFVTMEASELDEIASDFSPGIAILYGTFLSLTLSILYDRQRTIQDNVAVECSLLVLMIRNLLSLFKNKKDMAIEAGQCAADQIRTLVKSSRGSELLLIMYSDPYARMLDLVDQYEEELFDANGGAGIAGSKISHARGTLNELNRLRACRLSDEALALPPTHFLILNTLTLLILLAFTISILPTLPSSGQPANETSLLFAFLTTMYFLFYNFADDLNNPFRGVYQVRRSCAASHLLEAKWLIANHPLLRGRVNFEGSDEDITESGVWIRSPGLGDFMFEREDDYLADLISKISGPPL